MSTRSQASTPACVSSVLPHDSLDPRAGKAPWAAQITPRGQCPSRGCPGIAIPAIPSATAHSLLRIPGFVLLSSRCSLAGAPGQHRSLPEDGAGEVPWLNTTPGLPHIPKGRSSPALPAPALPCAASTALRFLGTGPRCSGAQDAAKAARAAFGLPGLSRTGQTELGSSHASPRASHPGRALGTQLWGRNTGISARSPLCREAEGWQGSGNLPGCHQKM